MPFVHVRLTGPITAEQKDRVMRGMTDVLVNELGKNPAMTWVVLEEVSREDWGVNGVSVATANKAAAAKPKPVRAAAAKSAAKPAVRAKAKPKAKAKAKA